MQCRGKQDPETHIEPFQLPGYRVTDLNLDGKTLYVGPDNDVNALLGNILLSPANSTASTNYILPGSLPQ
ncbi:MAG: hypothetical protein QJT81_00300 [Candidatus Thiothrix putei]|uniref:Uncharacterized protein n=1 Tax=Candidatus Thiothrix putei TaxID=3080811 RepID=A0AA95HG73_9GAMM|nr:MAG: hypothetical protein QJT81_00300 [Candidatus Thiothrix putei]